MRIVHISDLHFWHITFNPLRLINKRLLGMGNLVLNRAWKYRMETMPRLLRRIADLEPDHILITGDLTTTALDEEFRAVRDALLTLAPRPASLTVIPGNHDRYTRDSSSRQLFEQYFADFAPARDYPWLKRIGNGTAILAFDPCHPNPIAARGTITPDQIDKAGVLLESARPWIERLLIACHYPVALPVGIVESRGHGLRGYQNLQSFLQRVGPSVYCHGHVHATWAFLPQFLPRTLCLDPGAALKKRKASGVDASMLEIILQGDDVEVFLHQLRRDKWEAERIVQAPHFYRKEPRNGNTHLPG